MDSAGAGAGCSITHCVVSNGKSQSSDIASRANYLRHSLPRNATSQTFPYCVYCFRSFLTYTAVDHKQSLSSNWLVLCTLIALCYVVTKDY